MKYLLIIARSKHTSNLAHADMRVTTINFITQCRLQFILAVLYLTCFSLHHNSTNVEAFIINSYNSTFGFKNDLPQITSEVRLTSIPFQQSLEVTSPTAVSASATRCDSLTPNPFSSTSVTCIVWLADVVVFDYANSGITFPITPLLDGFGSSGHQQASDTLTFIPLVGVTDSALCNSNSKNGTFAPMFPCALLVLNTVVAQQLWLVNTATNTRMPIPEGVKVLPFNCSNELPCNVRTTEAHNGTAGGCSMVTGADTLVIVTWNQTRFIFRPLQYFRGHGSIHSIPSTEAEWLPFKGFDASLQFHSLVTPFTRPYKLYLTCVMHLLSVNGSTSLYDASSDDLASPTGLKFLTSLSVLPASGEVSCYPHLQHIGIGMMTPDNVTTQSFQTVATIISITCNNGYGALWQFGKAADGSVYHAYAGDFTMIVPQSSTAHAPLITDISVVALSCDCDPNAYNPLTGFQYINYVTKIALLGVSYFEESSATATDGNQSFATFATYTSDGTTSILTQRLISNSEAPEQLFVQAQAVSNPLLQHVRHGMGWVAASAQPANITMPFSVFSCPGSTMQMVEWYCSVGMLYGAVTEEFSILINGTTGQLAHFSEKITVSQVDNAEVPYSVTGGYVAWPVRLPDTPISFYRLPSAPLFTAPSRAGSSASVLIQRSSSMDMQSSQQAHLLVHPVSFVEPAIFTARVPPVTTIPPAAVSYQLLPDPLFTFMPSAITTTCSFRLVSDASYSSLSLAWASNGALVMASYARNTSRVASVSPEAAVTVNVFAGVAAFTNSVTASFDVGADNCDKGTPPLQFTTTGVINAGSQSATIYVCDANIVYGIMGGGLIVSTIDNLCYPANRSCMCSPDHPIFITKPDLTTSSTYIIITLYYPLDNATGIAVADENGNIVGRNSDLVIHGVPSGCLVSDEDTPHTYVFGDYADISSAVGITAVMTPIVGTRCMQIIAYQPSGNFSFAIFEHVGARPMYTSSIGFDGANVLLSTSPSLKLTKSRNGTENIMSVYSCSLFSFSAAILLGQLMKVLPRSAQFQGGLTGGAVLLGAIPSIVWPETAGYTVTQGLVTLAEVHNLSTAEALVSVRFSVWDPTVGKQIWETAWSLLVPSTIPADKYQQIVLFTSLKSSVCLSIGQLLCFDNVLTQQGMLNYFPCNCWGVPVSSEDDLLQYVWASPGSVPFAVDAIGGGGLLWEGLTWGSSTCRGSANNSPAAINQTSCSGAFISKNGLFLKCSFDGETGQRLVIAESEEGIILMANGPLVAPRQDFAIQYVNGNQMLVFANGGRCRRALSSLTLESVIGVAPADLYISACAKTDDAMYLFMMVGINNGMTATKTPFDPTNEPLSFNYLNSISAFSTWTFPTSFPTNNIIPVFSISQSTQMSSTPMSALDGALYPPVVAMGEFNVLTTSPISLVSSDGSLTLMSFQQCDACQGSCPVFCVLNVFTGEQIQYTSTSVNLEGIIKPMGSSTFNHSIETFVPVMQSGNVSLDIVVYCYNNQDTVQQITCQQDLPTTLATPARYCLRGSESTWSVIEISSDSSAMSATYTQGTSSDATYSGYISMSNLTIYSSQGELALPYFLNINLMTIPPMVAATIQLVSLVLNVSQRNTSDGQQLLTVATNAGDFEYSVDTCADFADVPTCSGRLANFETWMEDLQFKTVTWSSKKGNWGSGFVASGYAIKPVNILRAPSTGTPLRCYADNNNFDLNHDSRCTVPCIPTTDCNALFHFIASSYLATASWLPDGSTFAIQASNYRNCPLISSIELTNYGEVDLSFKMRPTSESSAMITVAVGDGEYVLVSSASTITSMFGVELSSSRCQFYILSNIVSQPFSWLALGAVKSLALTIVFYFLELKVRASERKKNMSRDRVPASAKLSGDNAQLAKENEKCLTDERQQPTAPRLPYRDIDEEETSEAKYSRRDTNETKGESQRNSLVSDAPKHGRGSCFLPNVIDKGADWLTTMSGVRHMAERELYHQQIRRNILPAELDDQSLVRLLQDILGAESDVTIVEKFADYYQYGLCNSLCWVVKSGTPTLQEHSDILEEELGAQLNTVHEKLRNIFKIFAESAWLSTLPLDTLISVDVPDLTTNPTSHVTNESDTTDNNAVNNSLSEKSSLITDTATQLAKCDPPINRRSAVAFAKAVAEFNVLHTQYPQCFEFAILSHRRADARLQPSALLVVLSLIQSGVTLLIYTFDIYARSHSSQLTPLQIYQCVYFMIFNSSLPSSLLVNVAYHRILQRDQLRTFRAKAAHFFSSTFVIAALILLGPGLLTHVGPGLVLFGWITVPLIGLSVLLERSLRRATTKPSKLVIVARMLARIGILFCTSVALSIAFNTADAFLWQSSLEQHPYMFVTGTYMRQPYFSSLVQDYEARSLSCVWEHLFYTISNFLQMGFFFV